MIIFLFQSLDRHDKMTLGCISNWILFQMDAENIY